MPLSRRSTNDAITTTLSPCPLHGAPGLSDAGDAPAQRRFVHPQLEEATAGCQDAKASLTMLVPSSPYILHPKRSVTPGKSKGSDLTF
jgi:hypothetical protein